VGRLLPAVTLDITIAPVDLPYARHIIPHQLRQWAGQVSDIQFTLDLHRSRGRYGAAYDERRPGIERLLERLCAEHPRAEVREVDYAPGMRAEVAERFFGGREIPAKDHYGAPVFAYFFGWHVAANDHILHTDYDVLFGGGAQGWTREAIALLGARADVVLCSPLPGPPTADGLLPDQVVARHARTATAPAREPLPSRAYAFTRASTRILFADRREVVRRLCPLPVTPPPLRRALRAHVEGHSLFQPAETSMTLAMQRRGLRRVDFLGEPPGMWSLHPPMRSDEFLRALPRLIQRVETGDIPAGQRGDYDVNDSMVDWSSARAALRDQRGWRGLARSAVGRLARA
jgi:hypothetical protein